MSSSASPIPGLTNANITNINSLIHHPSLTQPIIKHIPRSARAPCAKALAAILTKITCDTTDLENWNELLNFGCRNLTVPVKAGKKVSVASLIRKRLSENQNRNRPKENVEAVSGSRRRNKKSTISSVVQSKVGEGNIRAAVRILCSDETLAENNEKTFKQLQDKHPAATGSSNSPAPDTPSIQVTEDLTLKAVLSFAAGTAGGPDGIRPQHIKDLVLCRESGAALLTAITGFTNCLLRGDCPAQVRQVLFGGNLIAIQKKNGDVRPIAIGYTLRRLAAKCANMCALPKIADYLHPIKLGVGVSGDAKQPYMQLASL